jgi:hypothetical protein
MKRALIFNLALACVLVRFSVFVSLAHGADAIAGTARGPSGPLAGLAVQVVNESGVVVTSTRTAEDGSFSVSGLAPGAYTLHILGSKGAVIATTTVILTASAGSLEVSLQATAAALAAAAAAAVAEKSDQDAAAAAAAVKRRLTTRAAVIAIAAAAGGGAVIIVTASEASGRR